MGAERLSFKETMQVLARVFGTSTTEATALRWRVQQHMKLGFPEGINVGRGRAAPWNVCTVVEMACALSLALSGIRPELTTAMLKSRRQRLHEAAARGRDMVMWPAPALGRYAPPCTALVVRAGELRDRVIGALEAVRTENSNVD